MDNIVIFRNGKYYSYTNNNWTEHDLKSNKSTNKDASEEIVASFNKDIYTGRIIYTNDKPFIYNPTNNQGFKWKSWNDNSKKGGKTANKNEQDVLDKSLKIQTFAYLTNLRNQKGPENNISKTLQPIITTIKNASTGELNSGTGTTQQSTTSTIQSNINGSTKSSDIPPKNLSTSTSKSNIKEFKPQTYEKVKNILENSSIVTNDEFKGSSSNIILNVLKNIDKNILGMSNTLKTLNKTLLTFAEKQRTLEQIAENFLNAKPHDYQQEQKNISNSDFIESPTTLNGQSIGGSPNKQPPLKRKHKPALIKKIPKTTKIKPRGGNFNKSNILPSWGSAALTGMGLQVISHGMTKNNHPVSGTIVGTLGDLTTGYSAGKAVYDLTGSPMAGIASGLGIGIGQIKERLEKQVENTDWHKNYSRKFRKFFGIETEEDKNYKNQHSQLSIQEFTKTKEKQKITELRGNPKERAKEIAKRQGLSFDQNNIQYTEENGVVTSITDIHGKKHSTMNFISPEEKQHITKEYQRKQTGKYPTENNQEKSIKLDDNKFAAKSPEKFKKFAEYREQQMQSYINQIPSDISPEERQIAVQQAQQNAQKDAEQQFGITQEKPSAEKIPGPVGRDKTNDMQSTDNIPVKTEDGTKIGEVIPPKISQREVKSNIVNELSAQGITDPKQQANIMAQIQAESGFKPQSEKMYKSGKRAYEVFGNKYFSSADDAQNAINAGPEEFFNRVYGGRMGNAKNEGYKYRGRGLFQLTGKDNYAKYGEKIGMKEELLKNPDLVNDPKISAKLAAVYYKDRAGKNLNDIRAVNKATGFRGGEAEGAKRANYAKALESEIKSGKLNYEQMAENTLETQQEMIENVQNKSATKISSSDERAQAALETQQEMIENAQNGDSAKILQEAEKQKGWNETDNESQLKTYIKEGGHSSNQVKGDANAWCARYVGGVLGHVGYKGTGKDNAKSYLNYGQGIWSKGSQDFSNVKAGDIAVFNRGGGGKGHVAFVKSVDPKTGKISYVGGNQSGKGGGEVTESSQNINKKGSELLAIRRPDQISQENTQTISNENQQIQDNIPSQIATNENKSYTPIISQDLGMRSDLPTTSGENLSNGTSVINSVKDSLSIPSGGMGQMASGRPTSGGGGAPGGSGMANKSNDESGANIMGINIGLRNDESTLQRCMFSVIKIV